MIRAATTLSLIALLLLPACGSPEETVVTATEVTTTTFTPSPDSSVAASTTTTSASPAADTQGGDVTGAYFSMEALPVEFAELDYLSLANIDENAAPAPLNGFLRPKKQSAADYKLLTPRLDGKRLTFTTAAEGGIHYEFSGEFQLIGNFPAEPPAYETVVLTGTLKKMRAGNEIATAPVRFRYEAGG